MDGHYCDGEGSTVQARQCRECDETDRKGGKGKRKGPSRLGAATRDRDGSGPRAHAMAHGHGPLPDKSTRRLDNTESHPVIGAEILLHLFDLMFSFPLI